MSEEAGANTGTAGGRKRVLLCVVDETEELGVAIEFAALRAKRHNSRVALLYVINQAAEFQHWGTVGDLMREEARNEAERHLQRAAAQAQRWSGQVPVLYIREGSSSDELIKLINEDHSISILILAANTGPQGPGPLVTALAGKYIGRLRVPLVVVPGNLSDEALDFLA
ncbi:MAG: universal stress protein [Alphaproteobacteria bacterium]|nr:universal stress protein [Alphaproteobacteria bacterium]